MFKLEIVDFILFMNIHIEGLCFLTLIVHVPSVSAIEQLENITNSDFRTTQWFQLYTLRSH